MSIHDQAENLRKQVADASTEGPEDDQTYGALKVSVGRATRDLLDLLDCTYNEAVTREGIRRLTADVARYCKDICGGHDIEIPKETE